MAQITELIDTQDGHEIVLEAISNILAVEIAEQQVLATNAGQNPALWEADVYRNRMKPFDDRAEGDDLVPIINCWFQSATYNKDGSTVRANRADGTFNIDVYGFGVARDTAAGHDSADMLAKDDVDRWLGIVRRIIMSGQYTRLGSPIANSGPPPRSSYNQWCWGRWVQSITTFQPELETRASVAVIGSRLALDVHFLVDSPQVLGEEFESLRATVTRESDGRLLAEVSTVFIGEHILIGDTSENIVISDNELIELG